MDNLRKFAPQLTIIMLLNSLKSLKMSFTESDFVVPFSLKKPQSNSTLKVFWHVENMNRACDSVAIRRILDLKSH